MSCESADVSIPQIINISKLYLKYERKFSGWRRHEKRKSMGLGIVNSDFAGSGYCFCALFDYQ